MIGRSKKERKRERKIEKLKMVSEFLKYSGGTLLLPYFCWLDRNDNNNSCENDDNNNNHNNDKDTQ